eukprot:TRINITY_DN35077_c0_g1_i1.p3 TRINITY_DN35077_c0_g1~~TRINITY_DN35077_c0_g1_i1.p3  ORF type:complete len:114 (+),score=0.35 TRINITY_DN35077_c0_g1_i1:685-1026(+)
MVFYKCQVNVTLFNNTPTNCQEKNFIRTGVKLQVEISDGTTLGGPWICNNYFYLRIFFLMLLYSSPKNGMAPSGVGTGYKEAVCQFYVIIGDRYTIFTQRFDIAHNSRTHAKP